MLLQDKNTVIFGGGGAMGSAIARAFAREGARVFIAGRSPDRLEAVADDIRRAGGAVQTARIDAHDPDAVDTYLDQVIDQGEGHLDVSLNTVKLQRGARDTAGRPAVAVDPIRRCERARSSLNVAPHTC
jgi:3-oxoacyl-[acyl-carrier protein] reductase